MRVECNNTSMCIIPEDYRDELFLDQVLNIHSKKIFVRVKRMFVQNIDVLGVELKEFNPDIKRANDSSGEEFNQ